tara:strand:+ start:56 stop:373 length:318 start_codon:yes stop_codon:yes gene_type:complete
MNSIIGVLEYNNIKHNIYTNTIINPYCIYLPVIQNNKIKEFVYIDEKIITKCLYNIFINNMYLGDNNNYKFKKQGFINWIYTFDNINKSNWYVVINNMFKNNILN